MDRREAINVLRANVLYACERVGFDVATINLVTEALDIAIEALEREIKYGQMVVDFTKGEKVDDWVYDEDETATTTDCISRADTIKALCAECGCKDECWADCTEVATVKGMPSMSEEEVDYCNNCPYISWDKDCINRRDVIEAIEGVDWYHVNSKGELVSGATSVKESWYKVEDIYEALESLKPVTPPGKVLVEIKVDTEELIERIKEECQLEHGRLIDADKLLQELFTVDEEEWTTPEIRAILENAPTIITPTERTAEWIEDGYYDYPYYVCSNCGQECGVQGNGVEIEPLCTKYCPNCGAKMGE